MSVEGTPIPMPLAQGLTVQDAWNFLNLFQLLPKSEFSSKTCSLTYSHTLLRVRTLQQSPKFVSL